MRFSTMVQNCTLFSFFWATTKNAQKGPKYATFAQIGDMVYSKETDVHCEAQMRQWYGNLWKEKWLHRTIRNIIKKPVNRQNRHYYHVEYINPNKTTKLHELRDIHCRDTPLNVEDVLPHHPIIGLPGVTTPQDANLNTVTISPKLYNQMVDMLTIDMPETQEDDGNKDNEDKESSEDDSALPVAAFTDPISWFTDLDKAMLDANRPVDPVGWQFQGRDGKWMYGDDNMTLWGHFCPIH
jgi:hypothetical protein